MRRFSQRSSLVTLSEINITPLLDLAFVLLIIFVITTPLLEQSLELKLPKGGRPDRPMNERDVHTVEISSRGYYVFDGKPMTVAQADGPAVLRWRKSERETAGAATPARSASTASAATKAAQSRE